jgi:excisionase family DNA binding protein
MLDKELTTADLWRPDILKTSEAARLLRVTPRTVARWAQSGKLQAVRVGRTGDYRFTRKALTDYVGRVPF